VTEMVRLRGPWQQQSTRLIHETDWLRLVEDQVIKPNGKPGTYTYIEAPPFVLVIPQNVEGKILLIQLIRYPSDDLLWELPAGALDEGETTREAGARELGEETGLKAATWTDLGPIDEATSICACRGIVLLATSLEEIGDDQAAEEGITGRRWVTLDEMEAMARRSEITDSKTLAALLKLRLHRPA
jgi:8-oxo-dGDP phosphatase